MRAPRKLPQTRHVRRGYSTVFVGNGGASGKFTLRRDGVAGCAYFFWHAGAVAWKRELYQNAKLRTKVVPVEVTMRIVQPTRRARKAAKKR